MPYRSSSPLDAIKAFRNIARPGFARAVAKAAADWEFVNRVPIPAVPVEAQVRRRSDIALRIAPATFGETPLEDLVAVCTLVRSAEPNTLFEFGTFTGLGTLHLALNAPGGTVHTLDLEPPGRQALAGVLDWEKGIDDRVIGSLYREDPEVAKRVVQHWGDSRLFDTSDLFGRVDFVFIDAMHTYEFVKSDTDKALEMAAPGATIVWHDYTRTCPDVQRVVAELADRLEPRWMSRTNVAFVTLP